MALSKSSVSLITGTDSIPHKLRIENIQLSFIKRVYPCLVTLVYIRVDNDHHVPGYKYSSKVEL